MCSYGVRQTCMVLRRNKECPFSGITNSSSLEEGAKKRFLECDKDWMFSEKPIFTQPHNLSFVEVKNPLTDTCFLCPRKVWMRWHVAGSHMWIKFTASPVA